MAETDGVYGIDAQLTAPAGNDFRPKNPKAAAFGATAWKLSQIPEGKVSRQ